MKPVQAPPARFFTVSPSQIKAGIVTQLVVTGENFLPYNSWNIQGVKVLKQHYVDSRTMLLTVIADRNQGLRALSLPGGTSIAVEVVAADILLDDNFDDGNLDGWNSMKGAWTDSGGEAQVVASKKAQLFPTLENTDNVTIDWDMTLLSGKIAGIQFHYRDSRNFRMVYLDGAKNQIRLSDCFNGKYTKLKVPFPGDSTGPHHYTLAVTNDQLQLSIDGVSLITHDMGYVYSGQVVLYAKAATVLFDNFVITHDPAANVAPVSTFTLSAVGDDVAFDGSTSLDPDGTITSYEWDFGDGSSGTGANASHTYTQNGNYTAVLSVTDNSGARNRSATLLTVNVAPTDAEAVAAVVNRFFVLLADLEFRSPQEICQDFSTDPNCPARNKQVQDLAAGQPNVQWFDVQFLSDVLVTFQSTTVAYPVKIRNKLEAIYKGDPTLYYTDGWHTYTVQKEGDGKWHQCSYSFELISTNEN